MVVDEIAEIEDGKLSVFPGNYSEFVFEKELRLLRQQQAFQAQQKEITRLEQSAKRLLLWGHQHDNEKFIKRGKNILKRIERIDKLDKPVLDRKKMDLSLSGWRGFIQLLVTAVAVEAHGGGRHEKLGFFFQALESLDQKPCALDAARPDLLLGLFGPALRHGLARQVD